MENFSISYAKDASSFTFGPHCRTWLNVCFFSPPILFRKSALIYDRLYLAQIEAAKSIWRGGRETTLQWIEVHLIVIQGGTWRRVGRVHDLIMLQIKSTTHNARRQSEGREGRAKKYLTDSWQEVKPSQAGAATTCV